MNKVLFIADIGSFYRTGGGYTYAKSLLQILDINTGFQIDAVLYQSPKDRKTVSKTVDQLKLGSLTNVHIFDFFDYGIGKPWVDLRAALIVWRLLRRKKYDLIIIDQPNFVARFVKEIPIICMFHGKSLFLDEKLSWRNPRSSLILRWQRLALKLIYRRFLEDGNQYCPMFNSKDTLNKLALEFNIPSNQNNVLANLVTGLPLDTNLFCPDILLRKKLRDENNIKEDEIVILYISNFVSASKRSYLAPKLLGHLVNKKNIRMIFIGAGNRKNSSELEKFCASASNVIRILEIAPELVPGWLIMADINLSFSNQETFGYTVVEGMSCGLPSVIFSLGALSEQIIHLENGLSVQTGDEFIDMLTTLVGDPELRTRLGKSARNASVTKYSYFAWGKRFSEVVEMSLAKSHH